MSIVTRLRLVLIYDKEEKNDDGLDKGDGLDKDDQCLLV